MPAAKAPGPACPKLLSIAGILHHSMRRRQIKAEFEHHVDVDISWPRRRGDSSSGVDIFTK
jgi:hypothetical protein